MSDFKQKKALHPSSHPVGPIDKWDIAATATTRLTEFHEGWYEGFLDFKRMVLISFIGRREYKDTQSITRCKANSGQSCHNRTVDYLKDHMGSRSQSPSAKGKNFRLKYLDMRK